MTTLREVVRASLQRSVERIVRSDAAIRGRRDAEAVHRARVSVRRLRADLATFACAFAEGYAEPLAQRLRRLGDALGEARDADVLLARIEHDTRALPGDVGSSEVAAGSFRRMREAAYDRLVDFMGQRDYVALLADLQTAATHPPPGKHAHACARAHGVVLLNAAFRRARKQVRRRSRPPTDGELHSIRIKAKYVRYAAETLEPVLKQRATRLAKAAQRLQIVLGDQHDATIAAGRLAENAASGREAFVSGELAQRERDAAETGRYAWPAAWRAVRRCRNALPPIRRWR